MNNINFRHPDVFWLTLLLIPLILTFSRFQGRLKGLARWRRRFSILLQSLTTLLLLASLAEPTFALPAKAQTRALSLAVVLDVSGSISGASNLKAIKYAQAVLAAASPDDDMHFVAVARTAFILSSSDVRAGSWVQAATNKGTANKQTPAQDATDLAAGLRLAGSLLKEGGTRRVVTLTDGWQTQHDAAAEAAQLSARGIDLQVVPLSALGGSEVILKSVDLPSYARVGDAIQSQVTIFSSTATSATLRINVDGAPFTTQQVNLKIGENHISIDQQPQIPGFHHIDATVESSADTSTRNNAGAATLVVKPQPHVLVLEERAGEAAQISHALGSKQIVVDVHNSSSVPSRWSELEGYDSIVLNNVAATSLSLDQQRTLQEYVRRSGHGLVVIGGETSFAKGGYGDSVLEDMLPVSSQPGPRPQKGDAALILVLDRSQSMDEWMGLSSQVTKFSMAKEAARVAVDAMRPNDTFGVLTFDTENMWAVPVQKMQAGTGTSAIKQAITDIPLGGGTDIFQAVTEASGAIGKISASTRHLVLITDGHDYHDGDYGPLISRLVAEGVSLSTIGVGGDADKALLTRLARQGQGRYYFTEQIENLPKIVFKDMDLTLKEAVIEGKVQPHVGAPSPVLSGFSPQSIPQLSGYDLTRAKNGSVVALTSDEGQPLLAHWNYGLGRVVAFTSDAGPRWAGGWLSWNNFAQFWSQAVRWSMPSPANHEMHPSIVVTEQSPTAPNSYAATAHLSVESLDTDGNFVDMAKVTAGIRAPSGVVTTTLLSQSAPGRYEADVPVSEAGAYEVRLSRQAGGTITETAGFTAPPLREWMNAGTNDRLLKQMNSGKEYSKEPKQALEVGALPQPSPDREPLWHYPMSAALVTFLLSVAMRRLDFSRRKRKRVL
ncbi:MAG: VWA domain-containing protein [Chloroflexota bacterium]|nr:VWA domain-containing protein [Chloroflexota bacterium]